jgi:hypothetical protein
MCGQLGSAAACALLSSRWVAAAAGIVGSGHSFAAKRLAGQRSVAGWMSESMGGLSYLEFIRTLAKRVEGDWDSVQVRGGCATGWAGAGAVDGRGGW